MNIDSEDGSDLESPMIARVPEPVSSSDNEEEAVLDARPRRPTNRKGTKRIKRRRSYSERKRTTKKPWVHSLPDENSDTATEFEYSPLEDTEIENERATEQHNAPEETWPDSQPCSYCNESSPSSKTDYDCQHKSCDSCTTTLRNASECARCTSDSKLSRQSVLNNQTDTQIDHVIKLRDENGKSWYRHARLPEGNSWKTCSERMKRERVNIACSIIEALINDCDSTAEEVAVQFLDMIKNILTKKNRSLKNVSEEVINPKQRLISNEKSIPLLTSLLPSKNSVEKLRTELNQMSRQTLFGTREEFRREWKANYLDAKYECGEVEIELQDCTEYVKYSRMTNIKEVLQKWLKNTAHLFYFDPMKTKELSMRIGLDKGGEETKLSISFANCEHNQSRLSQLIVGCYTGPDTYVYLAATLSSTFEAIKEIKTMEFEEAIIPVVHFLTGDHKALSAIIGHAGQSSRHPCNVCTVDSEFLKSWTEEGRATWMYRSRAPPPSSQWNIKNRPLLDVPSEHIAPPMLHNILGPSSTILSHLLDDAAYVDHCMATNKIIEERDIPSNLLTAKKKSERKKYNFSEKDIAQEKIFCERYLTKIRNTKNTKEWDNFVEKDEYMDKNLCQAPWCAKRLNVRIPKACLANALRCAKCACVYHLFCQGIIKSEDQESADTSLCLSCIRKSTIPPMNPDPVIVEALNLLKANNSEKEQINSALKNYGTEKGLTNGLKKILKEVNVKIEAYHTGTLTGNSAKIFLGSIDKIVDPFEKFTANTATETKAVRDIGCRYKRVCAPLRRIQRLYKCGRLNQDEMEELKTACETLPLIIKEALPRMSITPKLHSLSEHTLKFAHEHGTLGDFSEQFIEAGHVLWNSTSANFTSAHTPKRLQSIMKHVNMIASLTFKKKTKSTK